MQDLRIQRVKVLMMLYTSNYFVKVRQKQLLDHTYALSRDQAFDYMTEFNKRLSDKVGIKCTMDILLPTDDDNANIIIEYNGIIKKLMKEAEQLVTLIIVGAMPAAVNVYIITDKMGGDGALACSAVVVTHLMSLFTMTAIIFAMRTARLI